MVRLSDVRWSRKEDLHRQFDSVRMHPRPDNIAQGEKSSGDGDPMGLAGLEHRLCPVLIERDGRNDGTPFFCRNPREGVPTNGFILARLEINDGDSAAETASEIRHARFDGTREDLGSDGFRAPALVPLLVQYALKVLYGILSSQKGEEIVGELMESHSVAKEMGCADEQIEIALRLFIVDGGR